MTGGHQQARRTSSSLRIPADLDDRYGLRSHIPAAERPVVFIGPYEHHSNELPVARIDRRRRRPSARTRTGGSTSRRLERRARRDHAERPLKIGSFSAASNVTGILSDTRAISVLLHRHGALSFWDFAAAGPYVEIEMAPHRPGRSPDAGARLQGRDRLSPAQVHRRAGHAGRPRRSARAVPQPRPDDARAAGRSPT